MRRRPWALSLGATAAVVVAAFALAAASDIPRREALRRAPGAIDRSAFLLVPAGRSRAEVRAILGRPRVKRPGPHGAECWRYGARSGRPVTFEICFGPDFVSRKAILPVRTPVAPSASEGRSAR